MNTRLLLVAALAAFGLSANASAALKITEAMSSSASLVQNSDWFELTNLGGSSVGISGYKADDNSYAFATSLALNGVTSVGAGESVIFIELSNAQMLDIAGNLTSFRNSWGGLSGVQVGYYNGSGIGLSSSGDGVVVFDGAGAEIDRVAFGASTPGSSFYRSNVNDTTTAGMTLSLIGLNGAFSSSGDIGSPGTSSAVPEPSTYGLMGAGALAAVAFVRRRAKFAGRA